VQHSIGLEAYLLIKTGKKRVLSRFISCLLLARPAQRHGSIFAFGQYRVAAFLGWRWRFVGWHGSRGRTAALCCSLHIHDFLAAFAAGSHHFAGRTGCGIDHAYRKVCNSCSLDLGLNLATQVIAIVSIAGSAKQSEKNGGEGDFQHKRYCLQVQTLKVTV
jgi:hypothetical protein